MRYVVFLCVGLICGCEQVSGVTDRLVRPADPEPVAAEAATGDPLVAPMAIEDVPETETAAAGDPVPVPTSGQTATTIAALGDPARPGAWMETPLVTAERAGQVHFGDKGVNVTLIPAGGPATGGSHLSLEAMQALGLPLTELTEVKVVF